MRGNLTKKESLRAHTSRDLSFEYYLAKVGRIPLPCHEEQLEMARDVKAAQAVWEEAKESADTATLAETKTRMDLAVGKMASANLRLVIFIAGEHSHNIEVDFAELVQLGNLGLITAVKKFDPELGFRFSTYARWWIHSRIQGGVPELAGVIRKPEAEYSRDRRLREVWSALAQEKQHQPTMADVARASGFPEDEVAEALLSKDVLYLNGAGGSEDYSADLFEIIADPAGEPAENKALIGSMKREIVRALESLEERKARILRLRFGLEDGRALTLGAVGLIVGLSYERVRQLEKIALEELRSIHSERLKIHLEA